MPNWLRVVLAIVAGFVVWFVVATVGNVAVHWFLPGYAEVQRSMQFSSSMLVARLVLGAVASLVAGAATAGVAGGARVAVYLFALLLLAMFVPVHVNLWAKFPVWYHVVFLGSLAPLVVLGAGLLRTRGLRAA